MEEFYEKGILKAIGISNFYADRMVEFASFNRIKPMVNQVECHPLNQQIEAKKWNDKYGIQLEAWAPFGEGRGKIRKGCRLCKRQRRREPGEGRAVAEDRN